MVVDDRPDLHVLLLRRRAGSAFVPGMDVFPGGGVDPRTSAAGGRGDSTTPPRARGSVSRAEGAPTGWRPLARRSRRRACGSRIGALHYAARWITPPGPPRRYDTRFFVTALPPGQTPVADQSEAVHAEWVRPAQALADFRAGARAMLPPTVGMLRILASYAGSAELLAAAARAESGPDQRVRLASEGERRVARAVAGRETAGRRADAGDGGLGAAVPRRERRS